MAQRKTIKRAGLFLVLAGLAAAPAGAVKDLSGAPTPLASMSVFGARQTSDNQPMDNRLKPGNRRQASMIAAVPEPAGWLLMLVGFGLLGAMNRRANTHPMRDELLS